MLCDSNIIIYGAEPNATYLDTYLQHPRACISSITRIEVLGFSGFARLDRNRQERLHDLIVSLIELPLNEEIIQQAIVLRQQRKMSLGDSIIAATALVFNLPLVTRNYNDFKHITNLLVINPMN